METTTALYEEFARFSSSDVADGLAKLGVAGAGFLPGLIIMSPQPQNQHTTHIVGPAYTAQYSLVSTAADTGKPRPAGHFVDGAPRGSIMVVACPSDMANACWGGLTTMRCQALGVLGLVASGAIRDVGEQRRLGFPTFAPRTSPVPPHGMAYISAVDEPVEIGASLVAPGDLIVADVDGVVCAPKARLPELLEMVKNLTAIEEEMAEVIRGGGSMTEASKLRIK